MTHSGETVTICTAAIMMHTSKHWTSSPNLGCSFNDEQADNPCAPGVDTVATRHA